MDVARAAGECILIVDDDPVTRSMVRGLLGGKGYRTIEAADGEEAMVQLARNRDVVLVVLDRWMPRMDGDMLLESIKRTPGLEDLPVLVLTSDVSHSSEIGMVLEGAHGYVRKPVKPSAFLEKVESAIRSRHRSGRG